MPSVRLGARMAGDGLPCYVIAEIGINHNGDIGVAKKLIAAAHLAGADAVKFQKRTVDVVYSREELARPRESPFGNTNGDLKYGLEFGLSEYADIRDWCREYNLDLIVSPWDEDSAVKLNGYVDAWKVASACLTDAGLLRVLRATERPIILSTGMSTMDEIDAAVDLIGRDDLVILHCTSVYPCDDAEINLRCIDTLRARYQVPIGYSGHERGLATTVAAVALGACVVERHITLDRSMFGSDQAASIEPPGLTRLVRDIRAVERAMGDGRKVVYPSELPVREKLRRVDSLSVSS